MRLSGQPADARLGSQAKRLAFLAYLVLARGPVRRDTLVALLWPEQSSERSRHSLRQTIYALRRVVGGAFLISRGDEELEVDPATVMCDAIAFESLLNEGRPEEALELYRGDFLEGLHPPDVSAEFEDWLTASRQRLRGLAVQAVAALRAR
ncbi:MAG TPA: hypothetical protein PKA50_01775, partial [Gemmatimonadales bacterium]|nr:hypothetical protein [Gemmatimonadales bacterium]